MMKNSIQRMTRVVLLFVLLALPACAPAAPSVDRQATIDAITSRVGLTATALSVEEKSFALASPTANSAALPAAGTGTPGQVPVSGATTTPDSAATVPVAASTTPAVTATVPVASATAPVAEATTPAATPTQAAVVPATPTQAAPGVDTQATAAAEAPIREELAAIGVNPNQGRVAWIHPPVPLEAEGFNAIHAVNYFPNVIATDFVMSADITWNTQYGDSGCGFVVRSDGDPETPSQYMVGMTRFALGHVGFLVLSQGAVVNGHDLYPHNADENFKSENDTTNRLTVVGQGRKFRIYTNGVFIGEIDPALPPAQPLIPDIDVPGSSGGEPGSAPTATSGQQLEEQVQTRYKERVNSYQDVNMDFPKGFVSLVALTNAGKVSCVFDNAYLWLIEAP